MAMMIPYSLLHLASYPPSASRPQGLKALNPHLSLSFKSILEVWFFSLFSSLKGRFKFSLLFWNTSLQVSNEPNTKPCWLLPRPPHTAPDTAAASHHTWLHHFTFFPPWVFSFFQSRLPSLILGKFSCFFILLFL